MPAGLMNLSDPMVSAIIARNKQLTRQGVPPDQAMAMMKQEPTTKPIEEVIAQYNALQAAAAHAQQQQQPQPQGTVSDQIQMALQQAQQAQQMREAQQFHQYMMPQSQDQGIAALPAENIGSEQNYARGGIVAFNDGGAAGGMADMFVAPTAEDIAGEASSSGVGGLMSRVSPFLGSAFTGMSALATPSGTASTKTEAENALKIIYANNGKDAFGRPVPPEKIHDLMVAAGRIRPTPSMASHWVEEAKEPVVRMPPEEPEKEPEPEEDTSEGGAEEPPESPSPNAPMDYAALYEALKEEAPKSLRDYIQTARESRGEDAGAKDYANYLAAREAQAKANLPAARKQAFNRALIEFGTPKEGQPMVGGLAGLGQALGNAGLSYQGSLAAIQKSQEDLADKIAESKWKIADAHRREDAEDVRSGMAELAQATSAYKASKRYLADTIMAAERTRQADIRADALERHREEQIKAERIKTEKAERKALLSNLTNAIRAELDSYRYQLANVNSLEERDRITAKMDDAQIKLNELQGKELEDLGIKPSPVPSAARSVTRSGWDKK